MSDINAMYREDGAAIESEIKRMTELEWPLRVSAKILPENLSGKTVGDIGAGPNPSLGKLIELRGGKYIPADKNSTMAKTQKKAAAGKNSLQADISHLPFGDKALDILHTRFVIMNLPEEQRVAAIHELARVGKRNIVLDYNWEKFKSEDPTIKKFIEGARKLGDIAGSDLNIGGKLKSFILETLPGAKQVEEYIDNPGNIKDYKTLSGLARSMQGLAGNLKNIETQNAEKNNRPINPILIEILVTLAEEMKEYELSFIKTSEIEDESAILPYTPPDIVAVSFE